ncbi:ATP-binding cassette domain-containing protein [Nonomuraea sp. 10N515B]|uniref:ATP-binding cassette domain-containing protein n=1 Tax=Nonomuraea sp. 10N515B TaxID=3457422 RepID=UPI003FCD16F6
MGLAGFEDHYPHELSGGMRKRAGIVRTLAYDSDVVLMDEPFGPLDAQTRVILQDELLKLWELRRPAVLFVTHDLVEAWRSGNARTISRVGASSVGALIERLPLRDACGSHAWLHGPQAQGPGHAAHYRGA